MFMSSMFRRFLGLGVVRRLGAWAGNPSSGLPGGAARHNRTQRKGVAFVAVTGGIRAAIMEMGSSPLLGKQVVSELQRELSRRRVRSSPLLGKQVVSELRCSRES